MSWQMVTTWLGPALDGAVIVLLGALLLRLREDPTAAWAAAEARLRELQENLRLLVAQAEGEARELDRRLGQHAERIAVAGTAAAPAVGEAPPRGASLAERVQEMVAARMPIVEIARRLSMPVAEARVLAGLTGASAPEHPPRGTTRMRPAAPPPGARLAAGASS